MTSEKQVFNALKKVVDPELGYDIVSLGLIRKVSVNKDKVVVTMTLTTPYCPYGSMILSQAEQAVKKIRGVTSCKLKLIFEPPWEPPEELKAMLGL